MGSSIWENIGRVTSSSPKWSASRGLTDQIALRTVTAEATLVIELRCGLHTFGDDPEPEALRQIHHGADDGRVLLRRPDAGDEAPVDLDHVDGEPTEVAERGVRGSEVVERDVHALGAHGFEHLHLGVVGLKQRVLGQFQGQHVGADAVSAQRAGDRPGQIGVELAR